MALPTNRLVSTIITFLSICALRGAFAVRDSGSDKLDSVHVERMIHVVVVGNSYWKMSALELEKRKYRRMRLTSAMATRGKRSPYYPNCRSPVHALHTTTTHNQLRIPYEGHECKVGCYHQV